jgi:hypothetical protein
MFCCKWMFLSSLVKRPYLPFWSPLLIQEITWKLQSVWVSDCLWQFQTVIFEQTIIVLYDNFTYSMCLKAYGMYRTKHRYTCVLSIPPKNELDTWEGKWRVQNCHKMAEQKTKSNFFVSIVQAVHSVATEIWRSALSLSQLESITLREKFPRIKSHRTPTFSFVVQCTAYISCAS